MNEDNGSIHRGIVGWDTGEHYDLGVDSEDGHTLVHVQLFDGRDPTKPAETGKAAGRKLLCMVAGGVFYIPPVGTPVVVAVPVGMWDKPGGPVILAVIQPAPKIQHDLNRVKIDFGPDAHVIIRGKSVTLSDYGAPSRYLMVGTPPAGGDPGITCLTETGTGWTLQGSNAGYFSASGGTAGAMLSLAPGEAVLTEKAAGIIKLKGGITILAPKSMCLVSAAVNVGAAAKALTPAMYSTNPPAGGLGLPSTSVFISP